MHDHFWARLIDQEVLSSVRVPGSCSRAEKHVSGGRELSRSKKFSLGAPHAMVENLAQPAGEDAAAEACIAGGYIATRQAGGKSVRFKRAKR